MYIHSHNIWYNYLHFQLTLLRIPFTEVIVNQILRYIETHGGHDAGSDHGRERKHLEKICLEFVMQVGTQNMLYDIDNSEGMSMICMEDPIVLFLFAIKCNFRTILLEEGQWPPMVAFPISISAGYSKNVKDLRYLQ